MVVELYPNWKNGILTQEEYLALKGELNGKLQALDASIEKLRRTAAQHEDGIEQENAFLTRFRKYRNFTELTRPMVTELVKEIRSYEGGCLEIHLNFRDEPKALTDYLDLNREIPKSCAK